MFSVWRDGSVRSRVLRLRFSVRTVFWSVQGENFGGLLDCCFQEVCGVRHQGSLESCFLVKEAGGGWRILGI